VQHLWTIDAFDLLELSFTPSHQSRIRLQYHVHSYQGLCGHCVAIYLSAPSCVLWCSSRFPTASVVAAVADTNSYTQLHLFASCWPNHICVFDVDVFVLFSDGILHQEVMMLNFFPQLNESEFSSNHEFVFIIDRSGVYYQTVLSFDTCLFTL